MIPHSKPFLGGKDRAALASVLSSGMLTAGRLHKNFGNSLEKKLGVTHIDLTTSGTMAFYKILLALGISEGDEVLLPNYICHTLIAPVISLGAKVIPYDNEQGSWTSSNDIILEGISARTKLVVINHTFGYAFKNLETLRKLIPEGIQLVEDCCHAFAPELLIGNEHIGQHSICAFYSFNATKLLSTGEGGGISTNDTDFFSELKKLELGDSLSDLSCALGIAQLDQYDDFLKRREEIAERYLSFFSDYLSEKADTECTIFFRFPILHAENNKFWSNNLVAYRKGVDSLLSDLIEGKNMSNSAEVLKNTISLPIYPALTNTEVDTVIEQTKSLLDL